MSITPPSAEDYLPRLEAEWKQADKACDDFIANDAQIRRHRVRFQLKPECECTREDKREIILLMRRLLTDGELPILHHVGEKLQKPLTHQRWAFRRQRANLDPALAESRTKMSDLDRAANEAHTNYHRHLMTLRAKPEIDRMEEAMTAYIPVAYNEESVAERTIDSDNNLPSSLKQFSSGSFAQRAKSWMTRNAYRDTVQNVRLAPSANTWVEKSSEPIQGQVRNACADR